MDRLRHFHVYGAFTIRQSRPLLLILSLALLLLGFSPTHVVAAAPDDSGGGSRYGNVNVTAARPSFAAAEANSIRIFNSVRAAMRQWPSSTNHNGFSIIPAVVPAGTLLYHGSRSPDVPSSLEWLAFEEEHARFFAHSIRGRWAHFFPYPPGGPVSSAQEKEEVDQTRMRTRTTMQGVLEDQAWANSDGGMPSSHPSRLLSDSVLRGYFHTFRARHDLRLLYIDGSSASGSPYGTLDTTDFVMRAIDPSTFNMSDVRAILSENERATELCAMAPALDVHGFIRMEAGFEVIFCDFNSHLDRVSVLRQPRPEDSPGSGFNHQLYKLAHYAPRFVRAAAEQYGGIGSGRVALDFSGMTSALWLALGGEGGEGGDGGGGNDKEYNVWDSGARGWNISSWDASRPELERAGSATFEQLAGMRRATEEVVADSWARFADGEGAWRRTRTIDWQGVVDMIVSRYENRIAVLADGPADPHRWVTEISDALDFLYVDWPANKGDLPPELLFSDRGGGRDGGSGDTDGDGSFMAAMDRCVAHYLLPVRHRVDYFTPADHALHAAIAAVLRTVCTAFLRSRELLTAVAPPTIPEFGMPLPPVPDPVHVGDNDDDNGSSNQDSALRGAMDASRAIFKDLKMRLNWVSWSVCATCAVDEVCFIPMYPFGSIEDLYHPGCRSFEQLSDSWWDYWWPWVPRAR